MTALVAAYVIGVVLRGSGAAAFMREWLALNPDPSELIFKPWQIITYGFIDLRGGFGGLIHVLFNAFLIVWIGEEFEQMYGSRRMLILFFGALLLGAAFSVLAPYLFGAAVNKPVYSVAAGVLGVIAAVVRLFPGRRITLFIVGSVSLMVVLIVLLVIDLLGMSAASNSLSGLGGVAAGVLYAAYLTADSGGSRVRPTRSTESAGVLAKLEDWLGGSDDGKSPKRKKGSTTADIREFKSSAPVETDEVDRILDKILDSGYDSLSEKEKRILDNASRDDG